MAKTPEELKEYHRRKKKEWNEKNREAERARCRDAHRRDSTRINQIRGRRRKEKPERYRAVSRAYGRSIYAKKKGYAAPDYCGEDPRAVEVRMLERQGWRCAICGVDLLRDSKTHLDHCHKTGRIRGALCNYCNIGIGTLEDSPEILASAIKYIVNNGDVDPPAVQLRVQLIAREVHKDDPPDSTPMVWEVG